VDELDAVRNYLKDIGVDFGADLFVPLFYDYSCFILCSNKY